MGKGGEGHFADALEQSDERRITGKIGAQRKGVDKKSNQIFKLRILAIRDSLVRIRNVELALGNSGACLFARQDYRRAYQRFQESLAQSRKVQRPSAQAFDELYLGRIYERENDSELAIEHYERGLRDQPWISNEIQLNLGLATAYRSAGNAQNLWLMRD